VTKPHAPGGGHALEGDRGPTTTQPSFRGVTQPPERGGKWCRGCDRFLALSSFGRHAGTRDGLESRCRDCARPRRDRYRVEHPEHDAAYNQRRRLGPFEKVCVDCATTFEAARHFVTRCPGCQLEHRRARNRVTR
jgi:hypothetical protein